MKPPRRVTDKLDSLTMWVIDHRTLMQIFNVVGAVFLGLSGGQFLHGNTLAGGVDLAIALPLFITSPVGTSLLAWRMRRQLKAVKLVYAALVARQAELARLAAIITPDSAESVKQDDEGAGPAED